MSAIRCLVIASAVLVIHDATPPELRWQTGLALLAILVVTPTKDLNR